MTSPVRLYYVPCGWRSGNFGDMFSAEIVARLSGRPVVGTGETNEEIATADIVACGSLAQNLPATFLGVAWGTGLMFEHASIEARDSRVAALRGKCTAARWPGSPDCPLGDPGLLVYEGRPGFVASRKRWAFGVVPHYVDMDAPELAEFLKLNREVATAIDPCSFDFPERVSECEVILSSSLHGLVVADALGIPNAWVRFSDRVQGADFKFRDYVSAFGIHDRVSHRLGAGSNLVDLKKMVVDEWTWGDEIAGVKADLLASFPELPEPAEPTDPADRISDVDIEEAA